MKMHALVDWHAAYPHPVARRIIVGVAERHAEQHLHVWRETPKLTDRARVEP